MSDPSRRRRPAAQPPPKRRSSGGTGNGPLPTVALAIGVIVAGLGIGALISAFQNRGTLPQLGPTSAPVVTPVAQPSIETPPPTLAPPSTPRPSPTAAPTASASPQHTARPTRSAAPTAPASAPATAAATAAAAAAPSARASSAAIVPASPKPLVTPKPPSATTAPPAPTPIAVRPAPLPPARPVASTSDTALAVVRRYLESLIAGDETGAYAALGGTSADRTLDLKEEAFLDKDAKITSMRASKSDATGATVDAEITTGRGSYVATFRVVNAVITQHDFIKI